MNEIQIFKHEKFGSIRVAEENGEPWFCAMDVTKTLGYTNGRKAIADHCKDGGVTKRYIGVQTGQKKDGTPAIQEVAYSFINEGNLYRLITHSKLPAAEHFEKWVFDEVLPSIRKHRAYMSAGVIEKTLTDPDFLIKLATELKKEKEARIEAQKQIELQAPKVEYYDDVLNSQSTYTTTQIAKELGIGAPTLNQKLHKLGVQYKQNGSWLVYYKYQNQGFTKSKTLKFQQNGRIITKMSFEWTETGREFIHKLLNKAA